MFSAADQGMQDRGKAKPGDKTIIDAIHPAAEAFAAAVAGGASLAAAGAASLAAAEAGRDSVTPLRSKIGRASWVGERTEGLLDPGCAMFCMVLGTMVEQ
jgi:dihydroxyacetone kinase